MILTRSCVRPAGFGRFSAKLAAVTLAVLTLGGCAYNSAGNQGTGPGIDNPVERKFTWFSYLDAADIRNSCAAGGPDQYRLVYNGQYYDHVRTYEVSAGGGNNGPKPQILARARGTSGNLLNMSFGSFDDLLGPWNFRRSEAPLSESDWAKFRDLLHQSGFAAGDQAGLRLHSQDYYWLAAGCENGQFHFNAWADKRGALPLGQAKFVEFLLKRDATGIAYKAPTAVTYMDKNDQGKGTDRDYAGHFVITIHRDGIGRAGI